MNNCYYVIKLTKITESTVTTLSEIKTLSQTIISPRVDPSTLSENIYFTKR